MCSCRGGTYVVIKCIGPLCVLKLPLACLKIISSLYFVLFYCNCCTVMLFVVFVGFMYFEVLYLLKFRCLLHRVTSVFLNINVVISCLFVIQCLTLCCIILSLSIHFIVAGWLPSLHAHK